MTSQPTEHTPRLRNHWWPRPGWAPGRDVYTWHLTFDHDQATELHQLVIAYQQQLIGLPDLNPVPTRWLHLTLQAVGWVDETADRDVGVVVRAVQTRVAELPPFELTFDRPVIRSEAIALHPEPAEPVCRLLDAVHAGVVDNLVPARIPTGAHQTHGFQPHVSLAYSAGEHDSGPYVAALDAVRPEPATVLINRVDLIRQKRLLAPDWLYRWTTNASAQLG